MRAAGAIIDDDNKEPNYVMNMMSTYGTLNEVGINTKRIYKDEDGNDVSTTEFKYT